MQLQQSNQVFYVMKLYEEIFVLFEAQTYFARLTHRPAKLAYLHHRPYVTQMCPFCGNLMFQNVCLYQTTYWLSTLYLSMKTHAFLRNCSEIPFIVTKSTK